MQLLEPEVWKAINSIHNELMATGTEGSTPKQPSVSLRSPKRKAETASSNVNVPTAKEPVSALEGDVASGGKSPRGKLCYLRAKCGQAIWEGRAKCLK